MTRVFSQGGLLLILTFLTRNYKPGELGVYLLFTSVVGLVAVVAALGTSGATEKYLSEGHNRDEWFTTGLILTIVLAVAVAIGFVLLNPLLGIIPVGLAPLFLIALPVNRLTSYYRHVLRAEQRASLTGYLQAARVVMFGVLSFFVVQGNYTAEWIIISSILASGLLIPPSVYLVDSRFTTPSWDIARQLFSYGKFYIVDVVGAKLFYFADIVILGTIVGSAAVGLYEVAWRLILAAMLLNGIITRTAFAYISEASGQGDDVAVGRYLDTCLRYVFIVPFGIAVGAVFVGSELIAFLFTPDYMTQIPILSILGVGLIFQSAYYTFSRTLFAMDHPWAALWPTIIGITANLGLNIVLIIHFDILGAAVATSVSYGVITVAYYRLLRRHANFTFPVITVGYQAGGALVMGACLLLLTQYYAISPTASVIAVIGIGGLIYLTWLLAYPKSRSELFELAGIRSLEG